MVIPVIIGATGIVTKGLTKNLEAIPGKHAVYIFTIKDNHAHHT
jgi:hypothetical protein